MAHQVIEPPRRGTSKLECELDEGKLDIARYARERDRQFGSSNMFEQFLLPFFAALFRGVAKGRGAEERASSSSERPSRR